VFAATLFTIPNFYFVLLVFLLPAISAIWLFWLGGRRGARRVHWRDLAGPHEIVFCIASVLAPLVPIFYSKWSGIPFWNRYGLGAMLGVTLILAAFLACATKRNSNRAVAAAVLILTLFCVTQPGLYALMNRYENVSPTYRAIDPELPFVTACGLTFLEMDHRESPEFSKRLYYLTDRKSALEYVHSNFFEAYPAVRQWIPIRANISPYREFAKLNRRFLVLTAADCPLDWLLLKLKDDGAKIRFLQDLKTGYHDRELYEVTLP
jgi:hypothetical protein